MPTDTFTTQPLYVRLREYGEGGRKLQEPEDQNICYETLSCLLYMTGKLLVNSQQHTHLNKTYTVTIPAGMQTEGRPHRPCP